MFRMRLLTFRTVPHAAQFAPTICADLRWQPLQLLMEATEIAILTPSSFEGFPGYVAAAISNFADPNFPAPTIAVWEESRHPWVSLPPDTPPKRMAKQG